MAAIILHDRDIEKRITPQLAIDAMRTAFGALQRKELQAPPRITGNLGNVSLDFTAGALDGQWFGYRSNGATNDGSSEQVVVLQDFSTRSVKGMAIGQLLGPYRTGAIGGVAVDLMSRRDSKTVGILGSGPQAWTQLWAIASIRDIDSVLVFSPNPSKRTSFARRSKEILDLRTTAVESAKDAVESSDIVILATDSSNPVFDAQWLKPGTHINTLGPKYKNNSEFGLDTFHACELKATDSQLQLAAMSDHLIFDSKSELPQITGLSAIYTEDSSGRISDENSLFLSVGLAGTELFLLDALINA